MNLRQAAQQALEALEEIADEVFSAYDNELGDAILALRAALAEPERKPLTDEQISRIWGSYLSRGLEFARAIEAAHGIGEQHE